MQTFHAETQPFLDIKCGLSEGPFWEREENVLRFVDIVDKAVYRVNLDEGPASVKKLSYENSIGVTAALESSDDSFIFGGKHGIGISKKNSNETRLIKPYWTDEEISAGKDHKMRANDGAVDCRGRFWVSTLCDPAVSSFAPEGIQFRLDPDGQLHRMITGATIPNGLSWSKDNKIFYFTDTIEGSIFAYDFDEETGSISNKRVFFKVQEGGPDGHQQDEHGNLWVAIWGAWKVVRVSPEGRLTGEISVPTRCPTAVVFAGEDVYITSEKESEPEKYPEATKHDGKVFKCHVGVRGGPSYAARIKA